MKVFENVEVDTKLGAKRIKDELEYVSEDLEGLGFTKEIIYFARNT